MTLAELMALLEAMENGEDMKACIKAELEKLRKESAKHRVEKTKAEEELEELKVKLENAEPKGTGAKQAKTLQEQIDALKNQLEEATKAREEERQKRVEADITSQTIDALTKGNAIDPKEFAKLIIPNVVIEEDGTYSYSFGEGKKGTIAEGVESWLKERPWGVRDTQRSGSGQGQSNPQSAVNSNGTVSLRDAIAQALNDN